MSYENESEEATPTAKSFVEDVRSSDMNTADPSVETTDTSVNTHVDASIVSQEPIAEIADADFSAKQGIDHPEDDLSYEEYEQYDNYDNYEEYEEDAEEAGEKRRFWPPTRQQVWMGIAFWSVILLGAVLRFWGLGDRPLHHDESMHAYFSLQLMHNMENWLACVQTPGACYHYDPVLHGPFQFHIIAFVYKICELLGVPGDGANNYTARIAAATLGTLMVALPYFLRHRLGNIGAWLACFLLAISPSILYYSRFTREDIYMACFTLLLVVGVARYLSTRKPGWLIVAMLGFMLSYATKEATFLTVAIFGSFSGTLLAWELGARWQLFAHSAEERGLARFLPHTVAPFAVIVYLLVFGLVGKWFFGWLKGLSIFITASAQNMQLADQFVAHLKQVTVVVVALLFVLFAVTVFIIMLREQYGKEARRGVAKWIDPVKQPLLDTIFTMPWTHWFFATVCGLGVFLLLFTVLFTNIAGGIGDGIWQGIYYWLQQQQVARGGQPWYYYLMLIPLYEQIGLVFGLVGIGRCLLRPTRFRLFLVWWFVGSFALYTWAGEKMPWLTIHIALPMMLLAAIGLAPTVETLITLVKGWRQRLAQDLATAREDGLTLSPAPPKVGTFAAARAVCSALIALALLTMTLQNMYQLSYVHAADAPHEMMIYVQTATSVNTVMAKIEQLDKKYYGGQHRIPIALLYDPSWPDDNPLWPFAWYLRDYSNVCYKFPEGCPSFVNTVPVILSSGNAIYAATAQYGMDYLYHQYPMRTQWDQGYMLPPCRATAGHPCTDPQTYVGVGPLLWLSYGDNPPPGASFNPGLAAAKVWQWWWQRKAIGDTNGSYDMGLFIRDNLGVTP